MVSPPLQLAPSDVDTAGSSPSVGPLPEHPERDERLSSLARLDIQRATGRTRTILVNQGETLASK